MQDIRLPLMKALGDINRLKIVDLLMSGEKTVLELEHKMNVTQPTLSHHLKILCTCTITKCRHEGVRHYYSLNSELLRTIGLHLIAMSEYIDNPSEHSLDEATAYFKPVGAIKE